VAPANNFRATLRPYQLAGLNWLGLLDALGFGACLADDMGLGKTLQLLAFLSVKKSQKTTSLLIVPAALMANWRREADRFYPELAYYIAHPGSTPASQQVVLSTAALAEYDLVITTYTMVRCYDALRTVHWGYVILDEAQAIKNPGTHQTRAIKKLKPFLVLSLKAGGVGLNLTAANHVVHFDRWWNPAVENQAIDRAFLIGQQKNVVGHKFITQGTIEEKIDVMLEAKSRMSEDAMASGGEGWITELDNDQLLDLFRLSLS